MGPPGAAHTPITCRARSSVAAFNTSVSIATSCASAPSTVCGNPDRIPAGPVLVDAGSTITPGSRTESTPGIAADAPAVGIGAAANASRRACALCADPPVGSLPLVVVADTGSVAVPDGVGWAGWVRSHTHSPPPASTATANVISRPNAASSLARLHSPLVSAAGARRVADRGMVSIRCR